MKETIKQIIFLSQNQKQVTTVALNQKYLLHCHVMVFGKNCGWTDCGSLFPAVDFPL